MNQSQDRVAAIANLEAYDGSHAKNYISGAPHLKHQSLRRRYTELLSEALTMAHERTVSPRVLDVGAGEGTSTVTLLKLGAKVTAIDSSMSQLNSLKSKCCGFEDKLIAECDDINRVLNRLHGSFDIVIACSFLHHVPDYLGLVHQILPLIPEGGLFVSFQDPLRYDSLESITRYFSQIAYVSWRVFQGDIANGWSRYLRRKRGIYLENSVADNAEYHVVRNGIDHQGLMGLLTASGFECRTTRYFSTQWQFWQSIGEALKLENTFGIIAQRSSKSQLSSPGSS